MTSQPHLSPPTVHGAASPARDLVVARLVARIYEAAPWGLKCGLLVRLMRPLGVLSLSVVAGGVFARVRLSSHWPRIENQPEAVQRIRAADVMALATHAQQVSVSAMDGVALLIAHSPLASYSTAAVLLALLVQKARQRPTEDD